MAFRFNDLRVYQDSLHFVSRIFSITKIWSIPYRFSLGDQLQRAAISIPLNVAEGSSRTGRDFKHFLSIARGSCYECAAIIEIAKNEHLLTEKIYGEMLDTLDHPARMLTPLKNKVTM